MCFVSSPPIVSLVVNGITKYALLKSFIENHVLNVYVRGFPAENPCAYHIPELE